MAFEASFGESKENNRRHRKWTWMDVEHITENLQSDQRKPARGLGRESDAAKMPRNIFRYVLETSGLHQLFLLLLTVGVFLLEVVPLELQRRIVNDLVKHRDYRLVIVLCAVYAGAVLVQGGTKLVLNVYRSWSANAQPVISADGFVYWLAHRPPLRPDRRRKGFRPP
jgi:hypothetical protein